MKIFIGFTGFFTELPGLTYALFFPSVNSMTRFGTYPVIHVQSTDMVKVSTAIRRMQTYHKAYDPECFLFHERRMQKMYICEWALF